MTHTSRRKLFFGPLKWAALAALVSVGGLFASLVGLYSASKDKAVQDRAFAPKPAVTSRQALDLSEKVDALRQDVATNTSKINALATALQNRQNSSGVEVVRPGMRPEERSEMNRYEKTLKQLAVRLSELESNSSNSTENARELPVLKQQLTDGQERSKSEIDRLNTLFLWAAGIFVTVLIALVQFFRSALQELALGHKTINKAA